MDLLFLVHKVNNSKITIYLTKPTVYLKIPKSDFKNYILLEK